MLPPHTFGGRGHPSKSRAGLAPPPHISRTGWGFPLSTPRPTSMFSQRHYFLKSTHRLGFSIFWQTIIEARHKPSSIPAKRET